MLYNDSIYANIVGHKYVDQKWNTWCENAQVLQRFPRKVNIEYNCVNYSANSIHGIKDAEK